LCAKYDLNLPGYALSKTTPPGDFLFLAQSSADRLSWLSTITAPEITERRTLATAGNFAKSNGVYASAPEQERLLGG
jgi:hypothetical protein